MIAEAINSQNNISNIPNPVFLQALQILESSGLLNENLAIGSPARKLDVASGGIQEYSSPNGTPTASVALETIVDAISRAVLIGFQQGFSQGVLQSDGCANISFVVNPATELLLLNQVGLPATTNVHEALIVLGQELNLIKNGLSSLGVVIPPQIPIPTVPLILE
jgi:hypothetical protein